MRLHSTKARASCGAMTCVNMIGCRDVIAECSPTYRTLAVSDGVLVKTAETKSKNWACRRRANQDWSARCAHVHPHTLCKFRIFGIRIQGHREWAGCTKMWKGTMRRMDDREAMHVGSHDADSLCVKESEEVIEKCNKFHLKRLKVHTWTSRCPLQSSRRRGAFKPRRTSALSHSLY